MTVRKLVEKTGMTQKQFAEYFGIPFRTLQNWVLGQEKCRDYWIKLMQYKLQKEGLIDMSEREQAKQIIDSLPEYKVRKVLLFLKGVQFDNDMDNDTYSDELITE